MNNLYFYVELKCNAQSQVEHEFFQYLKPLLSSEDLLEY